MNLTRETVGDVVVVAVREGHLDDRNCDAFKHGLLRLIGRDLKVVVDLDLQLVQSPFFGVLLRRLRAAKGEMRLCALTPTVRAFVEIVSLHQCVDIFNTRDEAIKAFQA